VFGHALKYWKETLIDMAGYFSFVLANVEGVIQVIQENLKGLDYMLVEHFKRATLELERKDDWLSKNSSLPKELGRAFNKEMDTSSYVLLTHIMQN
jgi:hypothetical protein